jgi:hypothetical protein
MLMSRAGWNLPLKTIPVVYQLYEGQANGAGSAIVTAASGDTLAAASSLNTSTEEGTFTLFTGRCTLETYFTRADYCVCSGALPPELHDNKVDCVRAGAREFYWNLIPNKDA